MRTLSPAAVAALQARVVPLVQLVYMAFSPSPIALNTSNMRLTYGGVEYIGASTLGAMAEIADSPGEIKGVSFEISGVPSSSIAIALDEAGVVQGTPVEIRTALLDENYQIVEAPLEWTGRLDTMSIVETGETRRIQVTAESTAVDLLRGSALTYSNADQQGLYPGDRIFDLIDSQQNTPVVWPNRQWAIDMARR